MTCTEMDPNCTICQPDNPKACKTCTYSHHLNNSLQCVPKCSDPYDLCTKCDPQNPTQCASCKPEISRLSGGKCEPFYTCKNVANCAACDPNKTSQCGICKLGNQLDAGKCLKCQQVCLRCQNDVCNECEEGFKLIDGKCVNCNSNFMDSECQIDCGLAGTEYCGGCFLGQGNEVVCRSCLGGRVLVGGVCQELESSKKFIGMICSLVVVVILLALGVLLCILFLRNKKAKTQQPKIEYHIELNPIQQAGFQKFILQKIESEKDDQIKQAGMTLMNNAEQSEN